MGVIGVLFYLLWAGVYALEPPSGSGEVVFYPSGRVEVQGYVVRSGQLLPISVSAWSVVLSVTYDPFLRQVYVTLYVSGYGRLGRDADVLVGTASLIGSTLPFLNRFWYGSLHLSSLRMGPGWNVNLRFAPT